MIDPELDASMRHPGRSIQEFQLDLLLEEELVVDPAFATRFLAACAPTLRYRATERVARSYCDKFGEADLAVFLSISTEAGDNRRCVLLVEDKIKAVFQDRQAERYRERGEAGQHDGHWHTYRTVLVAPAAYIKASHGFDAALPLEEIQNWICLQDPMRRAFKVERLKEAISKENQSGVQVVDPDMTAFRAAYYSCLQRFNAEHGTDFGMRPPGPTYYGDTWFIFKSGQLPEKSELRHMTTAGRIELSFKDTDLHRAGAIAEMLEPVMKWEATGKYHQHATICLPAPKISCFSHFDSEARKVTTALLGAERLWRFVEDHRGRIGAVLAVARS